MEPVALLLMVVTTPAFVWLVSRSILRGRLRNLSIAAISAACVYVFILLSVAYVNQKLDADLAAFDLNGDGIFAGAEITPEQEAAMQRVTSDTGRALAPFTGAVFAIIYFTGVWFLLAIVTALRNRHKT